MATKANLSIDQGTTFSTKLTVTDDDGVIVDLTGYSANSMIRKTYTSSSAVSFGTSINIGTGEVTLSLTANATANIAAGRYVYDCELTDGTGTVSRLLEGIVTINPQVTR